jgi:hypothetical protein
MIPDKVCIWCHSFWRNDLFQPHFQAVHGVILFGSMRGKPRMFNDTRWPLAATARVYLFFVPDPVRQSISYVSFREYGPFN